MHITISTVPETQINEFITIIGKGDPVLFFSLLLQFGEAVMKELASGSVFTSGTDHLDYHEIDIRFTKQLESINTSRGSWDVELADIPDMQRLRKLMKKAQMDNSNMLLGHFMHWLFIASQVRWMEHSLFVMNARERRWKSFRFKPLDDVRKEFSY